LFRCSSGPAAASATTGTERRKDAPASGGDLAAPWQIASTRTLPSEDLTTSFDVVVVASRAFRCVQAHLFISHAVLEVGRLLGTVLPRLLAGRSNNV